MDARLLRMRDQVRERHQAGHRQVQLPDLVSECDAEGLSWMRRSARLTRRMCEAQRPVIESDQRIVFTRTTPRIPPVYRPEDWQRLTSGHTLHELGPISNICADWGMVLSEGLLGRRRLALASRERATRAGDGEAVEFLDAAVETIDGVLALAGRYALVARDLGRRDVAELLGWVPANPPRTFHEALQALRLLHAVVWLSGHYHVGLGRLDQYLWPYLEADLKTGVLDDGAAEELLEEFFISLNRDSDLYPGVQQGDNGQSLMLGGVKGDGSDAVNPLTWMALRAAREVAMIDPKVNLRISQHTDLKLLSLATELTKLGLGFPQYSNDDVVIPALVAQGYELEDARDYAVAACWEFLIPGKGMEVVNIGAVSLPAAADRGIREGLASGGEMDAVLERTAADIRAQVAARVDSYRRLLLPPAPYYSVLMDGCIETGRDLSKGLKYNNFGLHGACSAGAADALAAVEQFLFTDRSVSADRLLAAMDTNYLDDEPLRAKLAGEGPKVGNHDDRADRMLVVLFDRLADACESISGNGRGGRVRPGTGSAMYYIWLSTGHDGMFEPVVGATADGRRAGEYFGANLAPSQGVAIRGPISVLQSFGKIDYRRICNGGPITLELADAVFRSPDSIEKVALLVHVAAELGCQQLQLNTVRAAALRDAKSHPERHRDLIVRVWGWSGYFCELEEPYQDHVIARHAFGGD
ncbi:MAG TPA: pyruvate formate lyase family protein [Phycisphaerae bacterium]|nr:pyruvate formate lyase family protein [Phycisphaerae bacterium]HRY69454.1 pyruvate formate lyase family protein [Phycisphaerae bacterium]HSA26321.1 pyruvate formate lyase family protein [Phycisphaerae bacterium]